MMNNFHYKYLNPYVTEQYLFGKVYILNLIIISGKKADEKHTHQWCAFIRGPNNEDLSTFIEKVDFILHPSFEPPHISVNQMPFQII